MKQKSSLEEVVSANQRETDAVITVVLTADNHLGQAAFGLQPRKREEQQQGLRAAFQQAVDFAIGQGVDLFIQAGNLFDRPNPHEQDRSFVAGCLARLQQATIPAFALGGLDDTPKHTGIASAPQAGYAQLGALHYFDPAASELDPVFLNVRGMRVAVCGLGIQDGQDVDPLAKTHIPGELEQAAIPLLILHAPIEGLTRNNGPQKSHAVVKKQSLRRQKIFRTILAGYHPQFQRLRAGQCEVVVAGATLYMDYNHSDEQPGFVFLGVDAHGIRWCKHIAVNAQPRRQLVIQMSDMWSAPGAPARVAPTLTATLPTSSPKADAPMPGGLSNRSKEDTVEPDLVPAVIERLRPVCSEDAIVQLRLEGELMREVYHQLDLKQVRGYGESHCFAFAIDESRLIILDAASERESELGLRKDERLSLRQEVMSLADEWIATSDDEQEKWALRATKEELATAMARIEL